jgi:hypothetical protein
METMMPTDTQKLFDTLRAGTQLLTLATAKIDPRIFHRLAGAPFTIAVTLAPSPRADFLLDAEAAPVCTFPAADWPPGFGAALGELCEQVVRRQSDGIQRHVKGTLEAGGIFVVTIDPDLWLFALEMRLGDQTIAVGRLAAGVGGTC